MGGPRSPTAADLRGQGYGTGGRRHMGGPFGPRVITRCRGLRHRCLPRGTIVAMSTEALRTVKDRLSEFIDRVQKQHERVVITRNGTPAAVLMSSDDLESLEETLDLLSDRKAVKELAEARRQVAAGDVVRGVDAVRKLRGR